MTQREMALRMDKTQAAVSMLEKRDIEHVRVGDLLRYAGAMGLKVSITIG